MSTKAQAKATKFKHLSNYSGDVWAYELSKPIKVKKRSIKFVVAATPKRAYGAPETTIWEANVDGNIVDSTPLHVIAKNAKDAFAQLNYAAN